MTTVVTRTRRSTVTRTADRNEVVTPEILGINIRLPQKDIEKVIGYLSMGLSVADVVKLTGVGKDSVYKLAKSWVGPRGMKPLRVFKENKADILAMFQKKFLYGIKDDDIDALTVPQKILSFGILFDKERLIRGQPTSISGVLTILAEIVATKKEIQGRLEQLQRGGDTNE